VTTAFVLGGGGLLGAHEVGMLMALSDAQIRPNLVVGTSIGAINGAFVAADPVGSAGTLSELWQGDALRDAFGETLWSRAVTLARSGTHLHPIEPLGQMLRDTLAATDFAELKVAPKRPWQVGLTAFEIARRHRFHEEMSALPGDIAVHVLPTGANIRTPDLSQLRLRDKTMVQEGIDRAYEASASYLAALPGTDVS